MAAGDLTTRSHVWSRDEIGQLATAVNTMTDHLVASQDELARSNRRLAAINRVILAANRPVAIHDVLYSILGIVIDVMGLETSWIYLRDPEREHFHLATWYGVPDALQTRLLQQPDDPLCRCQQEFVAGNLQVGPYECVCQRLEAFTAEPGVSHITIPLASLDQGHAPRTVTYAQRGLEIGRAKEDWGWQLTMLSHLGAAELAMQHWSDALAHFTAALAQAEQWQDYDSGDIELAIACCQAAVSAYTAIGDEPGVAKVRSLLAELLTRQ